MGKVYAIIPSLGGNGKLPQRDLREIKGKSLVGIAISQAINSEEIDHVVVNTNNDEVQEIAENHDVDVHTRPERFARRDRLMEVDRLLAWQVEQLEDEGVNIGTIAMLYPTSPLRTIEAINDTVQEVTTKSYDSALTLYEDTRYLWKKDGDEVKPTNYDPHKRGPTQLEDWNQWVENKAVYAVDRDILVKQLCRLAGRISFVEMDMHRSINIKTPVDYELAKFIAEVDGASW